MAQWSHIRFSVRAALRNRELAGFDDEEGRPLPEAEAFERMCNLLSAGHAFIPLGVCDRWDMKEERCLGHEDDETDQANGAEAEAERVV